MISLTNIIPSDQVLAKHIDSYYFLKSDDENYHEIFTHYPHYRTTLNVHRHSQIEINEWSRVVHFDADSNIRTVFTNNISHAKQAQIKGAFNIIGILFKPFGINHFTRDSSFLNSDHSVCFLDHFWSNYESDIQDVFDKTTQEDKAALLDEIFSKLYRRPTESRVSKIVDDILESKGTIKASELEKTSGMSRRTVLRLLKAHLGCSISEFKQVVKFRNALDRYQQDKIKSSFTQLSYDTNYYDQSDFINHFKAFAGELPKEVLPKITTVAQKDLYWKFKH